MFTVVKLWRQQILANLTQEMHTGTWIKSINTAQGPKPQMWRVAHRPKAGQPKDLVVILMSDLQAEINGGSWNTGLS